MVYLQAHALGIVHRDFKPDNALVDSSDQVKVSDFGLARAQVVEAADSPCVGKTVSSELASVTQTGAILGTPLYMAPEQFRGDAATAQSDQFAFAVALHEAIFGSRPFVGNTLASLYLAIEAGPVMPTDLGNAAWLLPVLHKGLSFDPSKRFASMDDMSQHIAGAYRRRRRRPWLIGTAVAVTMVCAVVTAVALTPPPPPDPVAVAWNPTLSAKMLANMQATSKRPAAFVVTAHSRASSALDKAVGEYRRALKKIGSDSLDDQTRTARRECIKKQLREVSAVVRIVSTTKFDNTVQLSQGVGLLNDYSALCLAKPPQPPASLRLSVNDEQALVDIDVLLQLGDHKTALERIGVIEPTFQKVPNDSRTISLMALKAKATAAAGDYAQATMLNEQALSRCDDTTEPTVVLRILLALAANAIEPARDEKKAVAWLTQAQQVLAKARQNGAIGVETALDFDFKVALTNYRLVVFANPDRDARVTAARYVAAAKQAHGKKSPQYASALLSQAREAASYLDAGSTGWAPWYAQADAALAIGRQAFGDDSTYFASMLVNNGTLRQLGGDYDAAAQSLVSADRIYVRTGGLASEERIEVLSVLATVETTRARHKEAELYASEAIELAINRFGPNAKQALKPLELLAMAQQAQSHLVPAQATLRKARAMTDEPSQLLLLVESAIEHNLGNYDRALAVVDEIAKRFGDDQTTKLFAGSILINAERYQQAEETLAPMFRDLDAAHSPVIATALFWEMRAQIRFGLGDRRGAVKYFTAAADIRTMLHEPIEDPSTLLLAAKIAPDRAKARLLATDAYQRAKVDSENAPSRQTAVRAQEFLSTLESRHR